jgi:hypothetical protein
MNIGNGCLSFRAGLVARALLGLGCLAAGALAQGGGFVGGELFVYNGYAQGVGPTDGAILRCDPLTGTTSQFVDLYGSEFQVGSAVFDPYRQRVLFSASLAAGEPYRLWFADGDGTLQDSGVGVAEVHSMAPTGDGRVYMMAMGGAHDEFKWLDAAGKLHFLNYYIDDNYHFPAGGMIYDDATNSLILASIYKCDWTGDAGATHIRRLPLSADGTSVLDQQVVCVEYQITYVIPVTMEEPAGWSRLPGGDLLYGAHTNSNLQMPRMLSIDPATLTIMPFASNGPYDGAAQTRAVCWSTLLGKAVILDTANDVLRAFAAGETGSGTIIQTSTPLSAAGYPAYPPFETPAMYEEPFDPCEGGWIAYGAGVPGAGGLVPSLIGTGCPAPSAGMSLQLASAVGGASAVLFVGTARGTLPFKGVTLDLADVALTLQLIVGGAPGVPGAGGLTLPAVLPPDPALSGMSVFLQAAFGDSSVPHGVSLSNALEMDIG